MSLKILIAIILLIYPCFAAAQTGLGVETGGNLNYLNTSLSGQNERLSNGFGFLIALPVEIQVCTYIKLITGVSFLQKNFTLERTGVYVGSYEMYKNDYFQVPISIRFSTQTKVGLFAELGGYGAYWVSGRIKGISPDIFSVNDQQSSGRGATETFNLVSFNDKYRFNSLKDNRLECGWACAAGINKKISTNLITYLKLSCCNSLSSRQKNYSINQMRQLNQTIMLSAGFVGLFEKSSHETSESVR